MSLQESEPEGLYPPVKARWQGHWQTVVYDVSRDPMTRRVDLNAQIGRALGWVADAFDRGRMKPGQRLLIVGGGVAGLAAAVMALHYGADVVVVDENGHGRLGGQPINSKRQVHPTMYRWPCPGWADGFLARVAPPIPDGPGAADLASLLAWQAGSAGHTVRSIVFPLSRRLKGRVAEGLILPPDERGRAQQERRTAQDRPSSFLRLRTENGPAWVDPHLEGLEGDFNKVLVCTGPAERSAAVQGPDGWHGGFGYWEAADPLILGMYELVDGDPRRNDWPVLAVGAGDGGRQDLLHLITGRDVCGLVGDLQSADPVWMEELRAEAEENYRHAGQLDTLARDTDRKEVIAELADRTRAALTRRIGQIGVRLNLDVLARIRIVDRHAQSESRCFPLNRYLTLALAPDVFRHRYQLEDALAAEARCDRTMTPLYGQGCASVNAGPHARHCIGHPHTLTWPAGPQAISYLLVRKGPLRSLFTPDDDFLPPDWGVDAPISP